MHRKNPDFDSMNKTSPPSPDHEASFAETALKLSGKSEDEARRTGVIDKADDQVEQLFQSEYQTVNSPAHRAVWDRGVPVELFQGKSCETPTDTQQVMDRSLEIGTSSSFGWNDVGPTWQDLQSGDERVGRSRLLGTARGPGIRRERHGISKLRSVPHPNGHGRPDDCRIGECSRLHRRRRPGSHIWNDGTETTISAEPRLGSTPLGIRADGTRRGSDLTALKTRAELHGDHYIVNGEKLFITNVTPGRTIGLVCLIDNTPAVLVCDLPKEESTSFQLRNYGIYALKQTYNRGIIFKDFKVPAENLLEPIRGNGLTIAYHGLNLGRISLCANAAGTMRLMMASMLPWAKFRVTYGEPIANRELVQRRLGRLAGLVVACDALVDWCSWLIDEGYRGEMECIVAKIFGSESQKEAAIELYMKTHGGRSFLHGHMFGDNVHEFLAPCIYEGEGEMLGMAFFKSLVKQHGVTFFEPVGKALQAAGIRRLNPANPAHLWALRKAMPPYAAWWIKQMTMPTPRPSLPPMPKELAAYASWACQQLQESKLDISGAMRRHQLKLADRQCRIAFDSARVQSLIIILATSLYAARQKDEVIRQAAVVICDDLKRLINFERPSDADFRRTTKLGAAIADGGFRSISDVEVDSIMMSYD